MNNRTETITGIPQRGAPFYFPARMPRIVLAVLLVCLTLGMEWPAPAKDTTVTAPVTEEILPTAAQVQKRGLHMGDSITLIAAPVTTEVAESLLELLRDRNVRVVFVLSEDQDSRNPILSDKLTAAGHRVIISPADSGRIQMPYHLNASDIETDDALYTLFDGCVLLCPALTDTQSERLLLFADIVRTQGVRIVLPETEEK